MTPATPPNPRLAVGPEVDSVQARDKWDRRGAAVGITMAARSAARFQWWQRAGPSLFLLLDRASRRSPPSRRPVGPGAYESGPERSHASSSLRITLADGWAARDDWRRLSPYHFLSCPVSPVRRAVVWVAATCVALLSTPRHNAESPTMRKCIPALSSWATSRTRCRDIPSSSSSSDTSPGSSSQTSPCPPATRDRRAVLAVHRARRCDSNTCANAGLLTILWIDTSRERAAAKALSIPSSDRRHAVRLV
jgi:hypothetical protein